MPAKRIRTIPVHALDDPRVHLAPARLGHLRQGRLKTLCGRLAVTELSPFAAAQPNRCRTCFSKADEDGMVKAGAVPAAKPDAKSRPPRTPPKRSPRRAALATMRLLLTKSRQTGGSLMYATGTNCRRGAALAAVVCTSVWFATSAVAVEGPATPVDTQHSAAAGVVRLAQNTMAKVSYSDAQADRGEDRYEKDCLECHGEDLQGGLLGGPPLRSQLFEQHFGGAPASALFMFMSTQMPPNAPGGFSPGTYADLMAYILKKNGYQAGAELPSDVDELDNLIVEK
jgi:mono/diheme cytochrome c family protein